MEARRGSFEGGSPSTDVGEPSSPGFLPCSSPTNDNTLVYPWSQIPSSQSMFPSMDRPIPLRHPYLQPQFACHRADSVPAVRTQPQLFQTAAVRTQPLFPSHSVPANSNVVDDATEGIGGQRGRSRTTTVFNWDHQATLLLVDAKRSEWEEFESTTGRRGVMVTALEKWRKVQKRLASNGVVAEVAQIRSKWERMASDFKKVGDWNKQSGNEPYSTLSAKDRRDNKLPPNFSEDLFDAMDVWMHQRHSVNAGGVAESGASVHEGVHTPTESSTRSGARSEQQGCPESNDDDYPVEQPSPPVNGGRSLPPDATGLSNSGKRKKTSNKQDVVVDAITEFSSQLVDVERSRQNIEIEREERERARQATAEERETSFNRWQMELEERKLQAAQNRADNIAQALGLIAQAISSQINRPAGSVQENT